MLKLLENASSIAGTPLVVTAGQQDSRHSVTGPLLFGDLLSIAVPTVKWAQEVITPEQLRTYQACISGL